MARKLQDIHLDSKEARKRLKPSPKPYWTRVERGKVHLGYRRLGKGKSGTWIARHYLGAEKYQLEKLGNADDLNDADGHAILNFDQAVGAARARMTVRAESASGKKNKPWTIQDAMDDYLEYLEGEKKTARDARYKANAFILPKFGKREIASLTVDELRRWLADLAKTPPRIRTAKGGKRAKAQQYKEFDHDDDEAKRRRKATVNRVLTTFKAALNRAFKDGKVKSDAVWRRLESFKAVDAAREEFLTVEEAKRLINASEPQFRQLVQAALLTGCRYGELARLTCGDYYELSNSIYVRAGKTGKDRHVFLTEEGAEFFSALVRGKAKGDTMLLKASGTPWHTSQQIRQMKETCGRAKIKPAVGFHILRHTWASLAVMGGVPLLVVARNLGHSTTRMTEKHYGHLLQSYEQDQIRKGAPTFGIKSKSNVAPMRSKTSKNG